MPSQQAPSSLPSSRRLPIPPSEINPAQPSRRLSDLRASLEHRDETSRRGSSPAEAMASLRTDVDDYGFVYENPAYGRKRKEDSSRATTRPPTVWEFLPPNVGMYPLSKHEAKNDLRDIELTAKRFALEASDSSDSDSDGGGGKRRRRRRAGSSSSNWDYLRDPVEDQYASERRSRKFDETKDASRRSDDAHTLLLLLSCTPSTNSLF